MRTSEACEGKDSGKTKNLARPGSEMYDVVQPNADRQAAISACRKPASANRTF